MHGHWLTDWPLSWNSLFHPHSLALAKLPLQFIASHAARQKQSESNTTLSTTVAFTSPYRLNNITSNTVNTYYKVSPAIPTSYIVSNSLHLITTHLSLFYIQSWIDRSTRFVYANLINVLTIVALLTTLAQCPVIINPTPVIIQHCSNIILYALPKNERHSTQNTETCASNLITF